jgi:16S rRNA (guanine(966)-N(2))-methyltransferase RsmD
MRIISGKYKSRRLKAPKSLPVRPTTDMAKEALFNIINNDYYFQSIKVLDLFSGTGNISFEFASRGTENITAIDAHYGCVKFINQISNELDFSINTIKSDVFKYLKKNNTKFDIIFADPPYNFEQDKFENLIDLIMTQQLLEKDGLLILEHSSHTDLTNYNRYSYSKKYGGNCFSFFSL